MDRNAFNQELLRLAGEAGLDLSPEQVSSLRIQAELMVQWNLRTNLTRILDVRDIVTRHILDSLIPIRRLPRGGRALDVGTGAGFPGVPLRIFNPEQRVTLLEANRKKVSFLKVLLSRLSLEGLEVVWSTWETWAPRQAGGDSGYDLITMRAVKIEPDHLTRLASPLLRPEGCFAWWAGPRSSASARRLMEASPAQDLHFAGSHAYSLPGTSQHRQVLIWTKTHREIRPSRSGCFRKPVPSFFFLPRSVPPAAGGSD